MLWEHVDHASPALHLGHIRVLAGRPGRIHLRLWAPPFSRSPASCHAALTDAVARLYSRGVTNLQPCPVLLPAPKPVDVPAAHGHGQRRGRLLLLHGRIPQLSFFSFIPSIRARMFAVLNPGLRLRSSLLQFILEVNLPDFASSYSSRVAQCAPPRLVPAYVLLARVRTHYATGSLSQAGPARCTVALSPTLSSTRYVVPRTYDWRAVHARLIA
jgi:hypothetical protein